MTKKKSGSNKYANIIKAIIVFAIYFMWPYFITAILNTLNLTGELGLSIRLILNFILLAIIILLYKDDLVKEYKIFKKNKKKNLLAGFYILIIGFILFNICHMIIYFAFPALQDANYVSMSKMFSEIPVLLIISTIFYYPIIEEIVFKKSLKEIIPNKWIFIFISGFLNAFFQMALSSYEDPRVLLFIIPNAIFSMMFSYMYYKTDTIYTGIIYRMLYNVIPNILNCISTAYLISLI